MCQAFRGEQAFLIECEERERRSNTVKEDSIEDLKKRIAELECQNKALKQCAKLDYLAIKILTEAGHINEDLFRQARALIKEQ